MNDGTAPAVRSTATHPYAVRFILRLGSNVEITLVDGEASVLFGAEAVLVIKKIRDLPHHQMEVQLDVEAFSSASDAERAGQLLTFSLMWLAPSKRVTIDFARRTGPWPFAVRNRTLSEGTQVWGGGYAFHKLEPTALASEVARAYGLGFAPTDALLTSMQFFASSGLESSEVARFIAIMTALEALAEQQEYGSEIEAVLRELAKQVEQNTSVSDVSVRNSLASQIRNMKRESVSKAIRRLVEKHINDKDTLKFVNDSYEARSRLLHDGARESDLGGRTQRLEDVVRRIYSSMTGLSLAR